MVCRVERNQKGLQRKLRILRDLTGSKSVRMNSIILDAFDYIKQLKLKVEALDNQYLHLISRIHPPTEVKVERIGNNGFLVKVNCKKEKDLMVPILESFEEKGLNVLQLNVSCNQSAFCMEAITEDVDCENSNYLDVRDVTETVLQALRGKLGEI
ncbi:hypothetical protein C5167_049724 [Papaver somniferum]|uniref:Plant bHLH transcription factor ACT-like domain-containing protein n=1 Tax=Papaver somniferum TaxID=3469 RepID=A0A4Y7KLL7_PAPSO|nr:uncharacterized protein LOC113304743 isoform X2 [Papaver somniferum]RZC74243.1 hypothetical protein C5167_049724 [Papaver somniferum]